ncbi:hypothetical protein SAMN05660964_03295 [Thiothrix caldifontis]|jgi:hypothetical protein|uniref:Uncharacterized protein n=1 Tax=Thiothrix caldifontis TaxID=525918 RepID=A0A1H4G8I9_9GAMM|nr:hypothetical protein [Thiothrix caldifontis]SEB05012.1 hypothetical protein SAMN05660964_03295 [Thiothrix caldifontis]
MNEVKDDALVDITLTDNPGDSIAGDVGKANPEDQPTVIQEVPIEYTPFDDRRNLIIKGFLSDVYLSLQVTKNLHDAYIKRLEEQFSDLTSMEKNRQHAEDENHKERWMEEVMKLFVDIESYNVAFKNRHQAEHMLGQEDTGMLLSVQTTPDESPISKIICLLTGKC